MGDAENGQELEEPTSLGLFGWNSGDCSLFFCGKDDNDPAVTHYQHHSHPAHHAYWANKTKLAALAAKKKSDGETADDGRLIVSGTWLRVVS
jgi:hypothetical protein